MASEGFLGGISWGKVKGVTTSLAGKETVKATAVGYFAEGTSMFHMTMLGSFAIFSAVANQIEYLAERAEIADFYREELAAKNNKNPGQVTTVDLDKTEAVNRTIQEADSKKRKLRNIGIAASFVASALIFSLMMVVAPHVHAGLTLAFAAKVALGGLGYWATKEPLAKVGAWAFGANKDTTHDLIVDITRDRENGKVITREQVVEVFVSGNPRLSNFVASKYRQPYHELPLADKVRVASELSAILPIDKIVHNINLGTTKASELAFTVEGDVSGVLPKNPEEKAEASTLEKFAHHCKKMVHSVGKMFRPEKAHAIPELETKNEPPKSKVQHEQAGESPVVEFNHAQQYGIQSKSDGGKSHLEQQQERRANNVALAGPPTLQ